MLVICEKRRNLADELRSIRGIVVVKKAAEFVVDTLRKDNDQVARLREIESQMEFMALEKELGGKKMNSAVAVSLATVALKLYLFILPLGSVDLRNNELQGWLIAAYLSFDLSGDVALDNATYNGPWLNTGSGSPTSPLPISRSHLAKTLDHSRSSSLMADLRSLIFCLSVQILKCAINSSVNSSGSLNLEWVVRPAGRSRDVFDLI
nr:hypothetical protein [Tanacetum cinerariifolium]